MLDHVRSVGVDVVYVAPFVEMDCDMDRRGWSPRQIKSGFGRPKNSYRISNYDRIDPEYGAAPLFSLAGGKPVVCVGDGEEVTAFQMDVATPAHVKVVRVVGEDATLRPEDYGTYAAIVLSGAATADDDALRAYVERGGTLIVSGDPRRQGKVLGLEKVAVCTNHAVRTDRGESWPWNFDKWNQRSVFGADAVASDEGLKVPGTCGSFPPYGPCARQCASVV